MASNLPPGVSPSDIPGNRPQDGFADIVIGEYLSKNLFDKMEEDPELERNIVDMAMNLYWEDISYKEAAKLIENRFN